MEAVPCSSPHNNEIANTFPNLASKKINIDIFEQMGDICFAALSIYTNDSENTSKRLMTRLTLNTDSIYFIFHSPTWR